MLMELDLAGNRLELSVMKCLWWRAEKSLLLSDIHLGKAAHFRKHALPLPGNAHSSDYTRLAEVIHHYKPERIIVLGDLFHSEMNDEWSRFITFANRHEQITWTLVGGNHDILNDTAYREAGLEYFDETLDFHGLVLRHHPSDDNRASICGHLHPGVIINGKGRQRLRLPCFYLSGKQLVLPAFGALTGLHPIQSKSKGDRIFAIGDTQLFEL